MKSEKHFPEFSHFLWGSFLGLSHMDALYVHMLGKELRRERSNHRLQDVAADLVEQAKVGGVRRGRHLRSQSLQREGSKREREEEGPHHAGGTTHVVRL